MKKRVSIIALILLFIISLTSMTFADELKDKQGELDKVKDKIEDLNNKMDDVKEEKSGVLAELKKLDKQSDTVQGELDDVNDQVYAKQRDINKTTKELNQAIKDFEDQKELYSQRVRAMYMSGPSGYLEILLSSESFSDFISKAEVIKRIVEYDKAVLKEIKVKQDAIQSKKDKLTVEKNQLVTLEKSIASKKADIEKINKERKSYYAKLEKDQKYIERMLDEQEKASKEIEKEIEKILAASGSSGTYSGNRAAVLKLSDIGFTPRVTSPYGMRIHPIRKTYSMHTGMDLGIPYRTPIYAMSEGKVIISQYYGGYGNTVVIDHGGGVTSLYAHNTTLLVSVGQTVKAGQKISLAGSTGNSTGPHLHFEVRINGKHTNPAPYYILGK